MTTAADTFAAFLDTLAETLDLGHEERAQRLHLSRFHLARVVTAAGGEPPERMRRPCRHRPSASSGDSSSRRRFSRNSRPSGMSRCEAKPG